MAAWTPTTATESAAAAIAVQATVSRPRVEAIVRRIPRPPVIALPPVWRRRTASGQSLGWLYLRRADWGSRDADSRVPPLGPFPRSGRRAIARRPCAAPPALTDRHAHRLEE